MKKLPNLAGKVIKPAEPGGRFLIFGAGRGRVLAIGHTVDGRPRLAVFESDGRRFTLVEMFSYLPEYDRLPNRIPWAAYKGGRWLSPREVIKKVRGHGFSERTVWCVLPQPTPPS